MSKQLSKAQVNHLRRLLGWVRCEIPPAPGEVVAIVKSIMPVIGSPEAQQKMVEWHREASSVPQYLRAALKALEPVVREAAGEIVDGNPVANRKISKRLPDNRKLLAR